VIVVLSLRLQDTSNGAEGPDGDPHQLLAAFSVRRLTFVTPQGEMLPPNALRWKIGIGLVTRTPVPLPMATFPLNSAMLPCRSKPMPSELAKALPRPYCV